MGTWNPGPGATAGNDTFTGDGSSETVDGLGGNDTLFGGFGNDDLHGGLGDDILSGGGDNDRLFGGDGSDVFDGGDGSDIGILDYSSQTLGITLAFTDQTLAAPILRGGLAYGSIINVEFLWFTGGSGNDHIAAVGDYNRLYGGAGDDILMGGALSVGGPGNDLIDGGQGMRVGISYEDTLSGVVVDLAINTPQDTVGDGIDTLLNVGGVTGSSYDDILKGDDGDNGLGGMEGDDIILGRGGNDYISGFLGDDSIDGGAGNDIIYGYAGNDIIHGGSGDDHIEGELGSDRLYGEDGNDWLALQNGVNVEDDLPGEFADGGAGNDRIDGSQVADEIYGGDGDDIIGGQFGADTIFGGAGNDTINLVDLTSAAFPFPDRVKDLADGGDGDDRFKIGWGDTVWGGANTAAGDHADLFLENPFNIFESVTLDLRGYLPAVGVALPGGGSIVGIEHIDLIGLGWGSCRDECWN